MFCFLEIIALIKKLLKSLAGLVLAHSQHSFWASNGPLHQIGPIMTHAEAETWAAFDPVLKNGPILTLYTYHWVISGPDFHIYLNVNLSSSYAFADLSSFSA